MRQVARDAGMRKSHRAQLAEELERRVMLSAAIAAFAPQVTFGVGSQPRSVVTADVNLDGKPDLVVTNGAAGTVGVLLGNGSGEFGAQATFATGTTPFGVAVADVNRDGKPDLVVANNGSGNVSVLLGNGNGTFGSQTQLAAGTQARFVAIGDFNGDGKPDLAVANYGAGTVSVILGNGNGTFGGQVAAGAGSQPSSIAVGDFNRDGKLDLAVANKSGGTVSVLLGNGNGSFGGASAFGAGAAPFSIAAGDVNGDGKLDLVLAEETNGVVGVLLGNGNGTFGSQTTFGAGAVACAVVVGDFNGDGKLDVAAANYGSNNVSVLLGNGNGSFAGQKTFGVGSKPFAIAAGDVNRDGRMDLVAGDFGGSSVSVLTGDVPPYVVSFGVANPPVNNVPSSVVNYTLTFNEAVVGVDATDFVVVRTGGITSSSAVGVSGGGAAYTVSVSGVSASGSGTLQVNLLDDGSIHDPAGNPLGNEGLLSAPTTFGPGTGNYYVSMGDVNSDGHTDILFANNAANVNVVLGNGDGTFQADKTLSNGFFMQASVLADVNGDGKLDLLSVGNPFFVGAAVPRLFVQPGNGDGTFAAAITYATPYLSHDLVVADVNGDGRPDVITADYGQIQSTIGNTVSIFLGNGNGTFADALHSVVGVRPARVAVSDVNRDGIPDVVVDDSTDRTVGVLLGNGDGHFKPQTAFASFGRIGLAVADVNGDGIADVVGLEQYALSVSLGNGDGSFQAQVSTAIALTANSLSLADMNGDGRADVVVANYTRGSVMVYEGNGDGTFGSPRSFVSGPGTGRVAVGDLNTDGRPDVAVVNGTSNAHTILLGSQSGGFPGDVYAIGPVVNSIARSNPSGVTATGNSVSYVVTFSEGVTGVDSNDFKVVRGGGVVASGTVNITGSGAIYSVTVNGIQGIGSVELNLVDDDSIIGAGAAPLGGVGVGNGSFVGPTYSILQTYPTVVSINRSNPPGPVAVGGSVTYSVTFSEPVTGVGSGDFYLTTNGVTANTPVSVSGSGATYDVTVSGISGNGTLGLNLGDDGSIQDALGNRLQMSDAFASPQTVGVLTQARAIAVTDLNGDGIQDLVVGNSGANNVEVLLGSGFGAFQAAKTYAAGPFDSRLAVGDVNGDGRMDVAVSNGGGTSLSVLLGNGDGTLGSQTTLATTVNPRSIVLADVNGDGKLDLVFSNGGTQVAYGNTLGVMLGNGNGTFRSQQTFDSGAAPGPVVVGDLNGDGKTDLVAVNAINSSFDEASVLLGNGDGTFATRRTFGVGTGSSGIVLTDVNGDGKLDLVSPDALSDEVSILLGNGNGAFQSRLTLGVGQNPGRVAAEDVNGDGKVDLLVDSTNFVSVLVGNGDGSFQPQKTFSAGMTPYDVVVCDVNGDKRPDMLVVTGANAGAVSVMLNFGNGSFAGQVYTIAQNMDSVAGTAGDDQIMLKRDTDQVHLDWTLGPTTGQMSVSDVNGLTINGNGGSDLITLDYSNGNPFPNTLHLNGTFTVNGLQGATPLAGADLEIGKSTVWISYSGASPASVVLAALSAGYNGGAWNGTSANGVITSSAAAGNVKHNTAIGWADSGDGTGINATPNSVELMYALIGDVNLDKSVNITDVNALVPHYNSTGSWTCGDFNYDGQVNITDVNALVPNYNTSLGSQVQGAAAGLSDATNNSTVMAVSAGNVGVAAVNAGASTAKSEEVGGRDSWSLASGKSRRRGRR